MSTKSGISMLQDVGETCESTSWGLQKIRKKDHEVRRCVYGTGHAKTPREEGHEGHCLVLTENLPCSCSLSRGLGSSLKYILHRELTL